MKVKKILIGLGVLITVLVLFGIYKLSTFTLFDDDINKIEEFSVPSKDYSIRIYFVPSNATTQSNIQVRKFESGVGEVLESYERFNYLENYSIKVDTLILSIGDTIGSNTQNEVRKLKLP